MIQLLYMVIYLYKKNYIYVFLQVDIKISLTKF